MSNTNITLRLSIEQWKHLKDDIIGTCETCQYNYEVNFYVENDFELPKRVLPNCNSVVIFIIKNIALNESDLINDLVIKNLGGVK